MAAAAGGKHIVLITGANAGIGYEIASQLLQKGQYHVLVSARTQSKAQTAVSNLTSQSHPGTAEPLHLDVTDDTTIDAAASYVDHTHGRLDFLINNAGISAGAGQSGTPPSLREGMRAGFETNATGAAVVTAAFTPLIRKAQAKPARVINVSSGAGSIVQKLDRSSPMYKMIGLQYRASKAAMNMVTACTAVELEDDGVKVFAYCPGFTVSGLGGHNTAENGARPVADSVKPLIEVLEGKRDSEAPGFLHKDGSYGW